MIAENIQIVDLDAAHWERLLKLLGGEYYPHRKKQPPRASLRIIHQDGKALKAVHSEKGVIRNFDFPGLDRLEELARREGVAAITCLEHGAMRRFMHQVQSRLSLEGNLVEQGFEVYSCLRKDVIAGSFTRWPRIPLRDLKYSAVATVVKMVLAAGEPVIFAVFDQRLRDLSGLPILTSLVLRMNKSHEVDLITTTDGLVPLGLKISDWRKDYKNILSLAERAWGKPFLGIFTDLAGMIALDQIPQAQQLKAIMDLEKEKTFILDPFPLRLRMMMKMGGLIGKK
jgi:hypothetical protein